MKIQGSHPLFNAYKSQIQQQKNVEKKRVQSDQLDISLEAKKLQISDGAYDTERATYVEQIKDRVHSGEYKIDHETTAKKMIDFWTNRS